MKEVQGEVECLRMCPCTRWYHGGIISLGQQQQGGTHYIVHQHVRGPEGVEYLGVCNCTRWQHAKGGTHCNVLRRIIYDRGPSQD